MFQILGSESQEFNQWEQGKMVINPCMKAGDEVVFRNSSGATAVMIAREESGQVVCDVPNKLLQMCCNILVDLEQGKEQHSDCQTTFPVIYAQKPDGYKCVDNSVPDTRVSFNDLKDKPFEEISFCYLPESKLDFNVDMGGGMMIAMVSLNANMVHGGVYKVVYNGTEYGCSGILAAGLGIACGNMSPMGGDDTGEPFVIISSGEGTMVLPLDGSTSATVSIYGMLTQKLDPKFIPIEAVEPYMIDLNAHFVQGIDTMLTAPTFPELEEALRRGIVCVKFVGNFKYTKSGVVQNMKDCPIETICTVAQKNRDESGAVVNCDLIGYFYGNAIHIYVDSTGCKASIYEVGYSL